MRMYLRPIKVLTQHITYHHREHRNQKEVTKTEDFSFSAGDEQLLCVMDTHWEGTLLNRALL